MAIRRMIAATDFSAPARHAIERAMLLGIDAGASVELVHVANRTPAAHFRRLLPSAPADLEEQELRAARVDLHASAERVVAQFGVTPAVTLLEGPLIPSLHARAEEIDADLLVMGARGASFVRHHLLGSTPERMLGASRRALLIVKQPRREPYRRVLVPIDFSEFSARALRAARTVAPGATLVLLHAFEVPFEGKLWFAGVEDELIAEYRRAARQDAQRRLDALRVGEGIDAADVELVVVHGHPGRVIVEQETDRDCDLIAMARHGEGVVHELLIGSVTRRVIGDSQSDVLVTDRA